MDFFQQAFLFSTKDLKNVSKICINSMIADATLWQNIKTYKNLVLHERSSSFKTISTVLL